MALANFNWSTFPSSIYRGATGSIRSAKATPTALGALRYRCPVTGSFLLVTDDETLAWLDRPQARLRCAACGEWHLLTNSQIS